MLAKTTRFSLRDNFVDQEDRNHDNIGKFTIRKYFIESRPELVRAMLRDVIVLRAELRYDTDGIRYVGLHDSFHPLPRGSLPMEYEALITESQVGDIRTFSVEWRAV